jgi:hypothetical protein
MIDRGSRIDSDGSSNGAAQIFTKAKAYEVVELKKRRMDG